MPPTRSGWAPEAKLPGCGAGGGGGGGGGGGAAVKDGTAVAAARVAALGPACPLPRPNDTVVRGAVPFAAARTPTAMPLPAPANSPWLGTVGSATLRIVEGRSPGPAGAIAGPIVSIT